MKQSALATCEDMKGCVIISAPSVVDQSSRRERSAVVCPKPRRVGLINPSVIDPNRPFRRHVSNQQEFDAKAGAELLDLIVSKSVYGDDQSSVQVSSSPPFFCGSPPSRVSNPLIQDARFGDERVTPLSPRAIIPIPSGLSVSPNPSARKNGGFVRGNFGGNPAVRIEGFDCLDRDGGRNRSIPAWA